MAATWEVISQTDAEKVQRMEVPGGWLYQTVLTRFGASQEPLMMSTSFVPEPGPGNPDPGPPEDAPAA